MAQGRINREQVRYQGFLNAEAGIRHHTHSEDMVQYDLMKAGDPRAVDEARKMLESGLLGTLSPDPVKNARYIFVAATTLVCRFAIDGGMPSEDSYNASDLFIRRMDRLRDADAIRGLQLEMFSYYTKAMADLPKEEVYSPQVVRCIDHIRQHLNERVGTGDLAEMCGLSPGYLSTLFRRETGRTVTDFVAHARGDGQEHARALRLLAGHHRRITGVLVPQPLLARVPCRNRPDAHRVAPSEFCRYGAA